MEQGQLIINTNATLVDYILKLMCLSGVELSKNPREQQIVVKNYEAIKGYLF